MIYKSPPEVKSLQDWITEVYLNKQLELELCFICDDPTGRAGHGEDSLYNDEDGPFCDTCWEEYVEMELIRRNV